MKRSEKLYIEETTSTNTWLLEYSRAAAPKTDNATEGLFTVYTFRQTAGRGQTGNGWESEPGKNLSFSTRFPIYSIELASRLNLLVPLAVVRMLDRYLPAEELSIKWPNDVYWRDKKICGILCENVLSGTDVRCAVAGVGVNVNQEVFLSGAPNPVSMKNITGCDYPLLTLLNETLDLFEEMFPLLNTPAQLKQAYMERLYRRQGFYPYVERVVSTAPTTLASKNEKNEAGFAPFLAEIADVDDFGRLVLRREDGVSHAYHFKEIRFILPC